MAAASQNPDLADGRRSGAAPAASQIDGSKPMATLGDRVLELVGEWPGPAGDDQHLHREPMPPHEQILADRLASALVHHEPGWQLPRASTLARRYRVHISQIELAIEELIHRRIVRRLPNGQLFRASPAEYLLSLEGVRDLRSQLDPMGREVIGHRQVQRRRCPEEVGQTLGIAADQPVTLVKVMWTANGNPAGLTATYLADHVADLAEFPGWDETPASAMSPLMLPGTRADAAAESALRPSGLLIEMQPPPAAAARSLHLAPGSQRCSWS